MKEKINVKILGSILVGILIVVGISYGGYKLLNKEKANENINQSIKNAEIAFRRNGNVYILNDGQEIQLTTDGKCLVSFTEDKINNFINPIYDYPCYKILDSSNQNLILLKYYKYPKYQEQLLVYSLDTQSFHYFNNNPDFETPIAWNTQKDKFVFKSEYNIIKVDTNDFSEEKLLTYEPIVGCGGMTNSEYGFIYDEEVGTFRMTGGETLIWDEDNNIIVTNTNCDYSGIKSFYYQQNTNIDWPYNLVRAKSSNNSLKVAIFDDKKLDIYNLEAQIIKSYKSPVIGKLPLWTNYDSIVFVSDKDIWQFDIITGEFLKLYSLQNGFPVKLSVKNNILYFSILREYQNITKVDIGSLREISKLNLETKQSIKILDNADSPTVIK